MLRRKISMAVPAFPAPLPLTEEELQEKGHIRRTLIELTERLRRRNLNGAVRVARAAAAGRLPELEDHFKELGRRFRYLLDRPAEAAKRRSKTETL